MAKFIKENGKEILNFQLARFDGRDCFVEILDSMVYLEKPKFIIKFIRYNPNAKAGNKYTAEIPIYLDLDRADALASMILSGTLSRIKMTNPNAKVLFKDMGGTSRKNLEKYNKKRPDGLDESRQLIIEPGMKTAFVMKATLGAGEEDEKGLIVPKGMPEQQVLIGFDDETIIAFARAIQRKVNAMDVLRESNYQKQLRAYEARRQK